MTRTKKPLNGEDLAEQVKKTAKKKVKKEKGQVDFAQLIPTGSTMFNLACSDDPRGGLGVGKISNIIGDKSTGKSFLALTIFAEMAMKKRFKDYRFIYDDAEAASEFDLEYLFGKRTANRIEPPDIDDEDDSPVHSSTTQDFSANFDAAIKDGRPFVYVLDSLDALTSDEEIEKLDKDIKARAKGQEVKGTYGMERAKGMSQFFRVMKRKIKKTESALIIVSQTRDNISAVSFKKKTRNGGRALEFYCCHEAWTAIIEPIKKKVNGRNRVVGIKVKMKLSKNKITGKLRDVEFSIYYDYGVDDVGSMIDFLVLEGCWKKNSGKIKVTQEEFDLDEPMRRSDLIEYVEENNMEKYLKKLCWRTWNEIEEALKSDRKRKYA